MLSSVDLPHPLGPMTATISRRSIVRLKSRNGLDDAVTAP